jgi:hypothetical protein
MRRWTRTKLALALALSSCNRSDPGEGLAVDSISVVDANAERARLAATPEAARLEPEFQARLAEVGTDAAQLLAAHRPAYLSGHGLDVARAEFHDGFVGGFALDAAETSALHELGFVVASRPAAGPVDLYYRVFAKDLPVFVSADSILHAWHRSYDEILEQTELEVLRFELERVLAQTVAALPQDASGRDARLYLEVARRLLDPEVVVGTDVLADAESLIAKVQVPAIADVELLGSSTRIDFSQFIARGHYSRTHELRRYFQAMMWLGRVDLVLYDRTRATITAPRHELAARAIADALATSGAAESYATIASFYRVHVGQPNALMPTDLHALCTKGGATSCAAAGDLAPVYAAQSGPAYASTPIARPAAERRGELAMRLFPQRFAYDAWVTSKTTAPELQPDRGPLARTMASPLDVGFVLGSDRALEHMADELALPGREQLASTLVALRRTMDAVEPVALDETIYNHWLAALRALARPRIDDAYPKVMRTAAWHDRQLEAVLASWAELRHDTVLVVEQSEAVFGCQYPKGYVEPVPEVFSELDGAAAHLAALYAKDGALARTGHATLAASVRDYLAFFQRHMKQLSALAKLELAHQPMSAADLAFLEHTVDKHVEGYGGVRTYDGWYPNLYFTSYWQESTGKRGDFGYSHVEGGKAKPIVSDVHTDAPGGKVLEVAVGNPELLIVAIDGPDGVALYGGPVYSFHTFEQPLAERMTDETWTARLERDPAPERPAFARTYRAR